MALRKVDKGESGFEKNLSSLILVELKSANKILFCDTDIVTTQIYADKYLKIVPESLYDLEHQITYDHYFLFDIDVPWIADGLRDLGEKREEMFRIFKSALGKRKIPFKLVKGTYEDREIFLKRQIDQILFNFPDL